MVRLDTSQKGKNVLRPGTTCQNQYKLRFSEEKLLEIEFSLDCIDCNCRYEHFPLPLTPCRSSDPIRPVFRLLKPQYRYRSDPPPEFLSAGGGHSPTPAPKYAQDRIYTHFCPSRWSCAFIARKDKKGLSSSCQYLLIMWDLQKH